MFIEIRVSHKVDEIKRNKILEMDAWTIEIDLSTFNRYSIFDELGRVLFESDELSHWVHHPICEEAKRQKAKHDREEADRELLREEKEYKKNLYREKINNTWKQICGVATCRLCGGQFTNWVIFDIAD